MSVSVEPDSSLENQRLESEFIVVKEEIKEEPLTLEEEEVEDETLVSY